ncbi:MAG TPA: gamma-glutamylcyclotransferase family protein [Candidatus Eisenbacteria bacterium]
MPGLFSYGTLQQENVQIATFGRLLSGTPDTMIGFILAPLAIDDPHVVAVSGKAVHTIAAYDGQETSRIPGTVFEITDDELAAADRYEVEACLRVAVTLASGMRAWVYVDRNRPGPGIQE